MYYYYSNIVVALQYKVPRVGHCCDMYETEVLDWKNVVFQI